jgi:hypothetical protein
VGKTPAFIHLIHDPSLFALFLIWKTKTQLKIQAMKIFTSSFIVMLLLLALAVGQTNIPGGDVYGNWTAGGSPYLVEGDISVPADCTLIIDPGVTVDFQGYYIFIINGRIMAEGTESDSIFFRSANNNGYRGLKLREIAVGTDSSIFTYCRFQDGNCSGTWPDNCGGGIAISFSKVRIEHCLFIDNQAWIGANSAGGALALGDFNGIIRYNSFIDNSSTYGGAIILWQNSNALVSHNYFYGNYATYEGGAIIIWAMCDPLVCHNIFINNRANQFGGAISLFDNSSPAISYNLFYDNLALKDGGAIEVNGTCNPEIINNTIVFNHANEHGGGVDIYDESCPLLINNIIWGNQAPDGSQVYNWDETCVPDFFNNDVQYGKDSIGGFMPEGEWKANIDAYPEFEDTTAANFFLTMISPCIDAGVDSILDPDGTRSDMGAYYFDQTGIGIGEALSPEDRLELYCWPNPATEEVVIVCRALLFGFAQGDNGAGCRDGRLSVFDMTGNKVDELPVNRESVRYNAAHLPPGMYLLRLQTGSSIATGKLVKR